MGAPVMVATVAGGYQRERIQGVCLRGWAFQGAASTVPAPEK